MQWATGSDRSPIFLSCSLSSDLVQLAAATTRALREQQRSDRRVAHLAEPIGTGVEACKRALDRAQFCLRLLKQATPLLENRIIIVAREIVAI